MAAKLRGLLDKMQVPGPCHRDSVLLGLGWDFCGCISTYISGDSDAGESMDQSLRVSRLLTGYQGCLVP